MSYKNPRPDLNGAPKYLPDTGEMTLESEKWFDEIRWMAHMFPQLLDEIEQDEELHERECREHHDTGFETGYVHGLDKRDHEQQQNHMDVDGEWAW